MQRIVWVAAALVATAVASAAGAVAARGGADAGAADPTVTLQLVPRGPGAVSASPVGTDTETNAAVKAPCRDNQEPGQCRWTYPPGTTVTLTAVPDPTASFAGWSSPACPGTAPTCAVPLDTGVISVFALFSPLTVKVIEPAQGHISGPGGIDCPNAACSATFAAHAKVTLTYVGPGFQRWEFGCLPADQPTCTVDVAHQPTWVGVRLQNQGPPNHPDVVSVHLRVRKAGDGSGTVTGSGAAKIDCGGTCDGEFSEEDVVQLTAAADAGSLRGGWGGVCPDADASCPVAVAAFSQVVVSFAKQGPPAAPGGLTVTGRTRTSLSLAWQPPAGAAAPAGYDVSLDGGAVRAVTDTATSFDGLACGSAHTVAVAARDAAGARSAAATLSASTAACAATAPARLAAVAVVRRGSAREVTALLVAPTPLAGRLSLLRAGQTVASAQVRAPAGSSRLRLAVPRRVRGALLLRVVLRAAGGSTFQLERAVTVR